MIDLRKFCSTDPVRPYLHQPFSRGEWTFATDGWICVRLPRMPDAPEQDKPKAEDIFKPEILACQYLNLEKLVLPPKDDQKDCDACDGRGRKHDCPDCECVCEACNGDGVRQPTVRVGIGKGVFNHRHVERMQSLPGIRVGETDGSRPMPFQFDGGDGLIMPMRGNPEITLQYQEPPKG